MELTKAQQEMRKFIHQPGMPTHDDKDTFMRLVAPLYDDGMTDVEVDKMLDNFTREKAIGVYFYPPPPITCQEDIDNQIGGW